MISRFATFRSQPDISRIVAAELCAASVAACLGYAYYRSELPDWWRQNGGGIPYVIFWITFAFLICPYQKWVTAISISATLFTCGLEFLQLWHPDWLTRIRSTRFGAALLGSGFVWSDFPPYFIGGILGWLLLMTLTRFRRVSVQED